MAFDFTTLSKRMYDDATPEQRARMDAHDRERERLALTHHVVPAAFERHAPPPRHARGAYEPVLQKAWTAPVTLQIEGPPEREVLRFLNAVTGHEAYTLTEDLVASLGEGDDFCICAGTAGRYDRCTVASGDVLEYLRERRPGLFPDTAPAP